MSSDALRAEHDAVLSQLSTRESTRHFAHGALSTFAAVVLGGTAVRLWIDSAIDQPGWGLVAGAAAAACVMAVLYSGLRFVMGRRAHGVERRWLNRLRGLREQLGLDRALPLR